MNLLFFFLLEKTLKLKDSDERRLKYMGSKYHSSDSYNYKRWPSAVRAANVRTCARCETVDQSDPHQRCLAASQSSC
jgi:hypothetical protein